MKPYRLRLGAFSMIEIVLALGIVVFALLTLIALLPAGIKSNQISTEETQAASLLTMLESDLRNTHPSANGGKSQRFGLTLPYALDAAGRTSVNTALNAKTLSTTAVLESGSAVAIGSADARYQASVVYLQIPASGAPGPVHARLVVNWPPIRTTQPPALTSSSVSGFLETYVTFSTL